MAYKVIILYQLYMPSYFLGTFTEYPSLNYSLITSTSSTINSLPPAPQNLSPSLLEEKITAKRYFLAGLYCCL